MRPMHLLCTICLTCLLAAPGLVVAEDAAAQTPKTEQGAPAKSKLPDKETLAILSGLVALLGTAVPMIAKGFESVSSAARRKKDLQRIDELTSLMEKIKKEDILTASTRADVSAQIEAEIKATLYQLGRNREIRERAVAARERTREIRAAVSASALPLWRRIPLAHKPNGVLAWIAQPIFYFWSAIAIVGVLESDFDLAVGSLIFIVPTWLLALYARRRWERTQSAIEGIAASEPASGMAPQLR